MRLVTLDDLHIHTNHAAHHFKETSIDLVVSLI